MTGQIELNDVQYYFTYNVNNRVCRITSIRDLSTQENISVSLDEKKEALVQIEDYVSSKWS